MKTDFKFSNLLGTVYRQANLVFTPDGNSLLSPVGNRVSVFNLARSLSYTLPFSHRKNIACIDLNPQGNLLLSIDEDGRAILTILPRRISIYHFSFKSPVTALAFSPSGTHFVVSLGRKIQAWKTPSTPGTGSDGELDFAPFVLHREYGGHHDAIQSLNWSGDSRFFVSASKDLTARIWSLDPQQGFEPTVLAGHRETVREAWFSATQESVYTVSRDGALFRWEYVPKPEQNGGLDEIQEAVAEQWRIVQRDYFMQPDAKLKCACFHSQSNLLIACFNNGIFSVYELPTFTNIHTLSIASSPISDVTINKSGEWLAFGSTKTGQLLVWEHASESQILKQSSHLDTMTTLSYSPDSNRIITGADDGLIKIWDVNSGFHIATFTEHNSAVTASQYSRRGNILFTSSLDGSVRAWDMLRYRNFRTFTAPTRLSFSSLAIDPSAEIVCAASHDSFDIHIWSVQTGQLLDQLAGHEGPISSLAFTPDGSGTLVSGSWDHTIRLWSVFSRTPTSEPLPLTSNILCVAIRPDSLELCAATLDGALTFFNLITSTESSVLDSARRDISGGRSLTSRRTAASSPATKNFTTMTYSPDGTCLLAAGISKYICLYSVSTLTLIKKFTVSINLSLSGTQELLNSSAILSSGQPRDQIDAYSSEDPSDLSDRADTSLPGAKRGTRDAVSRKFARPEVRVTALQFSPTGRSFCAASTEGLLIYSLDIAGASDSSNMDFDPFDLAMDVTPQNIRVLLSSGPGPKREHEYLKALIMAFRLADLSLVRLCYLSMPYEQIPLLVPQIPRVYLTQLLRFIGSELSTEGQPSSGRHIEFHLVFLQSLLQHHGRYIKDHLTQYAPEMRGVMRGVDGVGRAVRRMSEQVGWEVEYLCNQPRKGGIGITKAAPAAQGALDEDVEMPGIVNTIVIGNHTAGEDAENEDDWIGLD